VRLERRDGGLHPTAERQRAEEAVELRLAVAAVETDASDIDGGQELV
jgi:hypothetical protein